jgi:hypothetical protein
MALFDWQNMHPIDLRLPPGTPCEVAAPWLLALERLGIGTHLRITVEEGLWTGMPGLPPCGPDGLPGLAVPDAALLLADCAPAALIGRIGGSSATLSVGDTPPEGTSKAFAVGSHGVVKLPDKAVGPLFLGFNLKHRPVRVESLRVRIAWAAPTFP